MKKRVAEEYEKNPPKTMSANAYLKDVTPKANQAIDNRPNNNKKKRLKGMTLNFRHYCCSLTR